MNNQALHAHYERTLAAKPLYLRLSPAFQSPLIIALKGGSPEIREKVFRNMSSRAAETLKEDLESRGPVKLSEVEAEQKELLKIVRRLSDEGQIVLSSGGDDEYV